MVQNMNQIGNPSYSIDQLAGEYLQQKPPQAVKEKAAATQSFRQVLLLKQQALQETTDATEVSFSKHASERLNSRNIHLTETQMQRLNQGIEQARDKNINESLVMLDNLAFIVNVKNNTVITALDKGGEANHVFTNIDGAVII